MPLGRCHKAGGRPGQADILGAQDMGFHGDEAGTQEMAVSRMEDTQGSRTCITDALGSTE